MPAIRTVAHPVNNTVTVSIPKKYRSYSFEVFIVPIAAHSAESKPAWAGLCEDAVTKNACGPHDMDSIRESIKTVERLQTV